MHGISGPFVGPPSGMTKVASGTKAHRVPRNHRDEEPLRQWQFSRANLFVTGRPKLDSLSAPGLKVAASVPVATFWCQMLAVWKQLAVLRFVARKRVAVSALQSPRGSVALSDGTTPHRRKRFASSSLCWLGKAENLATERGSSMALSRCEVWGGRQRLF